MAQTREEFTKNAIFTSKISGGNVNKSYWRHAVIYGDYIDLRVYKYAKITFNGCDTSKTRREDGEKRADSLARSKVRVYRLISANIRKHGRYRPIFATYTFKEPIVCLDSALQSYRRYLRRLQTYIGYKLKYTCVPQIQWERFEKTGLKVWHFHIVFYNLPAISYKIHNKFWNQGRTDFQYVKGARNIGAYLAGYFTKKDFEEIPLNRRFYYCSSGLIQPYDVFSTDAIDHILKSNVKLLETYEGSNFTQLKYRIA
jgi:hypothetical protein